MYKNAIDITNIRFGRLLVIHLADTPDHLKTKDWYFWYCSCDCGQWCVRNGYDLHNGKAISCGCHKREKLSNAHQSKDGLVNARNCYAGYVKSARRRKITFELSFEQFNVLIRQTCVYCGNNGMNVSNVSLYEDAFYYNGVDRIDSTKGYITDNMVTCCKICNWTKHTLNAQAYIDHCKKVAELNDR